MDDLNRRDFVRLASAAALASAATVSSAAPAADDLAKLTIAEASKKIRSREIPPASSVPSTRSLALVERGYS